jgi:hypothetical protein
MEIPFHCLSHGCKAYGRYERAKPQDAPKCKECGKTYIAASTQERVTWYRRRCSCAPDALIAKVRKIRNSLKR